MQEIIKFFKIDYICLFIAFNVPRKIRLKAFVLMAKCKIINQDQYIECLKEEKQMLNRNICIVNKMLELSLNATEN